MLCPNCKNEIDDDSRFCRFCGVEFVGEEEPVIEIQPEPTAYSDASLSSQVTKNYGAPAAQTEKKEKKATVIRLLAALIVLILICGVLLFVGLQTGKIGSGSGKETITDAEGEKIKQGHGTVEMSVQDTDGTIRKITSDKSLITPEAILKEYTSVMNGLKNDAPAFTKLRYQNLPTENQNLGAIAAMVLPIIERYVTSKTAARPIDYAAGNADSLPIQNSPYGCLLTDASRIKNAYCEILEDGAYKLVITLQTESNPAIPAPGATSSDSAVGGVFAPYDAAEQITAISNLALSNIDFTYTDCTAELIYTHKTQQVQSLTMTMNIDVTADAHIAQLQARIVDITEYTDIVY